MRFSREEIQRARTLRELGLSARPAPGAWFVTDDGFVDFVRPDGRADHYARNHTWLPAWAECRELLRAHGYAHPEFSRDEPDHRRIEVMGDHGGIVAGQGSTDLACLYSILIEVLSEARATSPAAVGAQGD